MYRGSGTDHPLSQLGWKQMHSSLEGQEGWSVVISSSMRRCKEFALSLGEEESIPVHLVDRLVEAGYGNWEGKTPDQVKEEFGQEYWDFYTDPINKRPTGAEPLQNLNDRVMSAFREVLIQYEGEKILLVSHAGVMRVIMGNILQMPLASQQKINIPYAGMYQVLVEPMGMRIALR